MSAFLVCTSYPVIGFNGFRYAVDLMPEHWSRAQQLCQVFTTGNLASIESPEEQEFIYQTFGELDNLWIGLHDLTVSDMLD